MYVFDLSPVSRIAECEGASSIAQYGRFGDACEETLVGLTRHLTKPEYTTRYTETPGWIPFSIPCIIKYLVGNTLSYEALLNSTLC